MTPTENVEWLLEQAQDNAYMVASCEEITEDTSPPHIIAKRTYEKYTASDVSFLATMEHKRLKDSKPSPIVFTIDDNGSITMDINETGDPVTLTFTYADAIAAGKAAVADKLTGTIVKEIYGADGVEFTTTAKNQIKTLNENGWDKLPICMAKTQYSLSDDPTLLGRPNGFEVTIQDLIPNTGAGFLVAIAGDIMRMPGLPKVPAAVHMDIDEEGISQYYLPYLEGNIEDFEDSMP